MAREAKISRISWVRSMTRISVKSVIERICEGLSSWLKTNRLASSCRARTMISASLPLPRIKRGLIWLRRCRTVSRTRTSAERASSASSASSASARCRASVVTLTRMARSPCRSTSLPRPPPLSSPSMTAISSSTDWVWPAGCTGARKAQFLPPSPPGRRCAEYIRSGRPSAATFRTESRSSLRKTRSMRSSSLMSSPARWVWTRRRPRRRPPEARTPPRGGMTICA